MTGSFSRNRGIPRVQALPGEDLADDGYMGNVPGCGRASQTP